MRRIKGYRIRKWKAVGIIGVIIFAVLTSVATLWKENELRKCLYEKRALEEQINSFKHMVYVASEKISKGTIVTEEIIHQEYRYSDLPNVEFVTEDAFGQIVAVDVAEGTCLTTDMLYAEEKNAREVFISEAEIPDYMQSCDRIDLRIRYANAEDYIVLADKTMVQCEPAKGMVLQLTEEEILLLSSAIADCKTYDDTKLYVVKYPTFEYSGDGTVNYIANQEILVLLEKEKTEGESRNALEERLMQIQ